MDDKAGYYTGSDPQSFIFFSQSTEVFKILGKILKYVDDKYYHKLEANQLIKVEDRCEQKLILSEFKTYILFYVNHRDDWYDDQDAYAKYLAEFKKYIAQKRDQKSLLARSLIKIYLTLFRYMKEGKVFTFIPRYPGEPISFS